jgi:hypothetical protein
MSHNGSLEDNVKALLRANLLRGPVDLMSEVMVLARTLQQKFYDDPEVPAVVEKMRPLREAAENLDVERTVALTEQWLAEPN